MLVFDCTHSDYQKRRVKALLESPRQAVVTVCSCRSPEMSRFGGMATRLPGADRYSGLSRSITVVQHLLTNTRTRFLLYSTEPLRSASGATESAAISPATRS
jgi:hypothetical protein